MLSRRKKIITAVLCRSDKIPLSYESHAAHINRPVIVKKYLHGTRGGLLLGLIGIIVLSPDSLLLRLFSGDDLTITAGRASAMAVVLAVMLLLVAKLRAGFRWWPVLLYAAVYALGLICFPLSIRHTFVANTLVILATSSFWAAIGGRIFLGEIVPRRTWLASIAAAVGVALVFAPQTTSGGLFGDILALGVAFSLAGSAIIIRRYPQTNMFPGLCVAAAAVALLFLPFADWRLPPRDFVIIAANGGVIVPLAFVCIIAASRRLPPAEINLLFLLETVLAPLWVWLVLAERPPPASLLGGGLIVIVLTAHSLATLRALRRARE